MASSSCSSRSESRHRYFSTLMGSSLSCDAKGRAGKRRIVNVKERYLKYLRKVMRSRASVAWPSQPSRASEKGSNHDVTSKSITSASCSSSGSEYCSASWNDPSLSMKMQCPVCRNTMTPPIEKCAEAHGRCPVCKPLPGNRCKRCPQPDEETTPWEYRCPYTVSSDECLFSTDNIQSLLVHLECDHPIEFMQLDVQGQIFRRSCSLSLTELHTWIWWARPRVLKFMGRHFFFQTERFLLDSTPVAILYVRLIGGENEAQNYSYSVRLGSSRHSITFQGTPKSILEKRSANMDDLDGLLLQKEMLSAFFPTDQEFPQLNLDVDIWRKDERRNSH